jgi:hypothetical protein
MDARQKRRIWKVAIAHFALTVLVVWRLLYHLHYSGWSGSAEKQIWFNAWSLFWLKFFVLLQPLFSFFVWFFNFVAVPSGDLGGLIEFLEGMAMFVSVPIWSICFGWLFIKLDNWLNHFPVLGKKVF